MDHFLEMGQPSSRPSTREVRAIEMFQAGVRASETAIPGEFLVPSQHGSGFYRVKEVGIVGKEETCECSDFQDRRVPCKHIFFVRRWVQESAGSEPNLSSRDSRRKTTVNWPVYTQAQKEEGRLFPMLLRELCAGVPDALRDPHKAGRPPSHFEISSSVPSRRSTQVHLVAGPTTAVSLRQQMV